VLSAYGTTLAVAAGRGHKSIGRQFLDAGANVNTVLKRDYGTALAATARNGHGCIVRQLLDVGANVNIVSRRWYGTALTGAAREGRERIVASCSMQALRQGCLKRRLR
jgi:ankyrin repeat protein